MAPVPGPERPVGLGAALFARYAYPPSALGYCGPAGAPTLFASAREPGWEEDVGRAAAGFEGAWPYLELIAEANGIADPLEADVVEAYFVGGPLLERVPEEGAVARLGRRFAAETAGFGAVTGALPRAGLLHHSFHVLFVYPWLRMARAGVLEPSLRILDRCRIRSGTVLSVEAESVVVQSERLRLEDGELAIGGEQVEVVSRSLDGSGPLLELAAGDEVSLHWDRVCDRLDRERAGWLRDCTSRNIAVANAGLRRSRAEPVQRRSGGAT